MNHKIPYPYFSAKYKASYFGIFSSKSSILSRKNSALSKSK
jgi:hypothetical protein